LNSASSIVTASGLFFDPINPDPKKIRIEDIAHALSRQTRFTGHVRGFWSGANHSLLVSHLVAPEHALAAQMHDAYEAYLIDLPSPVKRHELFDGYTITEQFGHFAVADAFSLFYPWHQSIIDWDHAALWAESEVFMHGWADWNFKPTTSSDMLRIEHARRAILDGVGQPWINRVAGWFGFYSPDATKAMFLREFSRLSNMEYERTQPPR
jgi:uncharacterized protein